MRKSRLLLSTLGLALAAGLFLGGTAAAASPSNDAFASAQTIAGESGFVVGDNREATREPGEPAHGGDGGRSVWYSWTAPTTGQTVFDTCGTGFDTLLAVYTGASLATTTRVAADDDGCSTASQLSFPASAGTVYVIAVDGYEAASGSFRLRWRPLVSPSHDDFGDAQPLSGARGVVEGTSLAAGSEPGERLHAGSNTASIWFNWTAPSAGTASFDTCASSFDTVLAVYTGESLATLTEIASNDDMCRARSRVRFEARAGTAYRVAIASGTGSGGNVVLHWVVAEPPANGRSTTPRRLRGPSGTLRTSNEGVVEGAPDHAVAWFRWRAPRTMGVTFDTCSEATLDTRLTVYRGPALRRAVRVDFSDDACEPAASRVAFFARKGVDYLIAVDGYRAEWGQFTLRWAPAGPSAAPCHVPELRGMTLGQARREMEQSDCVFGRVVYSRSAIFPLGRVIAQFPLPGTRLRFLGRVNVEVSGR